MSKRRRILNHLRANLVAYIALFFALSGSAYAAGGLLVYSDNIVDGQVFSVDVADDNLTSLDVQNGSLTGGDLANGTVSGQQITNGSITRSDIAPNSLTGVEVADNSLTGADVADNSLTGADIAENTLSVADMGCQSGKILGFARVKGLAGIPSFYTSDPRYIDIVNNCAGGPVEVRSTLPGIYHVRFVGNPAALAVATPNADGEFCCGPNNDNIISVGKDYSADEGWYFDVEVQDVCDVDATSWSCRTGGTESQNGNFTIVLP